MALASGVDQRVAQRERVDELDQPRARRAARTLSPLSHLALLRMGLVCATRVLESASGYPRGHRVRHLVLLSALSLRPPPPPSSSSSSARRPSSASPGTRLFSSNECHRTLVTSRRSATRAGALVVELLSHDGTLASPAATLLLTLGQAILVRVSAARDSLVQNCSRLGSLLCAVDTLKAGPPARARFLRRGLAAARGRRCGRAGSS